ncbi:hypothetical protein [Nostocoides sp. HKS02]|uniref:hypothetical protein n=1 Tax=Nostocoides sp. HKS02 TaxID=1813880 RepID=UPI0012B4DAD0|nr:hypothetical protein [Tetrasphaera sp. HKS02]QGN58242.1 hypothetical protein GKE56_10490 [Tetrasphaera sp. HKS02]
MKTSSLAAVALSVAISGALALGACGSSGTATSSSTTSSMAAGASSSAAGGALKAGDTVDGAALATRMTAAMLKAGSGTLTVDLGATGQVSGAFAIKSGVMEQQMAMTVQGQPMEIVSKGGIIYMKGIPGSTKPWVKIDPKATDPFSTMFAGLTGQMGDPRQLAKALEGTTATVVSSSADATVYDVTIDPSKLTGASGQTSGQTATPSVGPVKARYTLDAQDRPTAMKVDAQGQTVVVTFADWGKPVSVQAPPADQVGAFQLPAS